jgi:hypothetical protein
MTIQGWMKHRRMKFCRYFSFRDVKSWLDARRRQRAVLKPSIMHCVFRVTFSDACCLCVGIFASWIACRRGTIACLQLVCSLASFLSSTLPAGAGHVLPPLLVLPAETPIVPLSTVYPQPSLANLLRVVVLTTTVQQSTLITSPNRPSSTAMQRV